MGDIEDSATVGGEAVSTPASYSRLMTGRIPIMCDYEQVDRDNVVEVLYDTLPDFRVNSADIDYLWRYYKGEQPILHRVKEVRPEINNKIVENHAQEIVAFKVGYQLAEPLQYTCRKTEGDAYEAKLAQVNELNTLMFAEDKASCDRDLFEWMCIGGIGYRFTEADAVSDEEEGGGPFELYNLDPRITYSVRSAAYHHRQVMAVWVSREPGTKEEIFNVFTDKALFLIKGNEIVDAKPHTYGRVPIVEYQLSTARMGVFECALPILDAINAIESNRLDGIEQTVQALMKFVNVDIDEAGFLKMLKLGAIKITSREGARGDVDVVKTDLDQSQTQVTKDDLYQALVNICGMPNRNGTSGSSSDTGAAVLLRDGWTLAESHAKSYELQFKRSERDTLRIVLAICRQSQSCNIDLNVGDIELAFNRRNYENILVKAQVLTTMLKCPQIHPQLAFQACGLFTDPDAAYAKSQEHWKQQAKEAPDVPPASGGVDDGDPKDADVDDPNSMPSQATVPEPKQ